MSVELVVRFGYGALLPWVCRQDDGTLRAIAGPDHLTYAPSHLPRPTQWNRRSAQSDRAVLVRMSAQARIEEGERHSAVMRSPITLIALTYGPTGGIVAAPTLACRRAWAAFATGITGCAMPRFRCSR